MARCINFATADYEIIYILHYASLLGPKNEHITQLFIYNVALDHLEDLGVDGSIILKSILKQAVGGGRGID